MAHTTTTTTTKELYRRLRAALKTLIGITLFSKHCRFLKGDIQQNTYQLVIAHQYVFNKYQRHEEQNHHLQLQHDKSFDTLWCYFSYFSDFYIYW